MLVFAFAYSLILSGLKLKNCLKINILIIEITRAIIKSISIH